MDEMCRVSIVSLYGGPGEGARWCALCGCGKIVASAERQEDMELPTRCPQCGRRLKR